MFPFQDHRDQACGLQVKNPSLRGGTQQEKRGGPRCRTWDSPALTVREKRDMAKKMEKMGQSFKIKRRQSKSRNMFLFKYPQSYLCIWQTASMYGLRFLIKSFIYMCISMLFQNSSSLIRNCACIIFRIIIYINILLFYYINMILILYCIIYIKYI